MGQGIFANSVLALTLSLIEQLTQTKCGGCGGKFLCNFFI